jgi:cysteinyl-tRNA synthetase
VLFSEEAIEEAAVGLETFYRLFKRYHRITKGDFYHLQARARRTADASAGSTGNPALDAAAACKQRFITAMDDDFNTGGAIGELFELAKIANRYCDEKNLEGGGADNATIGDLTLLMATIKELANILGIFQKPVAPARESKDNLLDNVMQLVINLRAESRQAKNFATADAIRDGLAPTGVKLEDRAGGTEWSGGGERALEQVVQVLIALRQTARKNKDFATSDAIRDRLAAIGVKLEDRGGETEWVR